MDRQIGLLPTPLYARDPAANVAAALAANPSTDFSADGAAPTPTAALIRGLFMPPRVTSQGVAAPPVAANTRSIASKRPQSAAATGSQKKSKANAGCGVKPPAAFQLPSPPPEAPSSSQKFGAPLATPNVFEEIPTSMADDAYLSTMSVGSNNSYDHWSETNEVHQEHHEYEVDEDAEGLIVHRKDGRQTTPQTRTFYYARHGWHEFWVSHSSIWRDGRHECTSGRHWRHGWHGSIWRHGWDRRHECTSGWHWRHGSTYGWRHAFRCADAFRGWWH